MNAKLKSRAPGERTVVAVRREADFPIVFAKDALSPRSPDLLEVLRREEPFARHRVFFVIDQGAAACRPGLVPSAEAYAAAHKGSLILAGAPLVVAGGEPAKTRPEICEWIRARLGAAAIGERGHVVVIGGGALIDAAGFAAATLHGGARVTRVPTTLGSQAGAACWTDCALNAGGRLDWIRTRQTPFGVVIDPRLTSSQPKRHRRAALAQACAAALSDDACLFHWMAENARPLAELERRSVETLVRWTARLSAGRAAEGRDARFSQFGRWCAYGVFARAPAELLFGEACAIGAAVDILLSAVLAGLAPAAARSALETLAAFGAPLWHPALGETDDEGYPRVMGSLLEAGEREGAPFAAPLLSRLGESRQSRLLNAEAVAAAVEALQRWGA